MKKIKIKYACPYCKKKIIKDLEGYLENYSDETWMMCPCCKIHFPIEKLKEVLKKKKK